VCFLRNLGAAFVVSCFVASSASAVTVNFTYTATVDYIGDALQPLNVNPVPGQSIQAGDTFKLTYSLDTNAPQNNSLCFDCGAYDAQNAKVEFSSGYTADLTGHRLVLWPLPDYDRGHRLSYEFRSSAPDGVPRSYLAATPTYNTTTPFSADLTAFVALFDSMPVEYGNFSLDPILFGGSGSDCYGEYCFIAMKNWSGSVTTGGAKPTDPNVSAVPVPAPFAMLGMALLGLVRFGRSTRV